MADKVFQIVLDHWLKEETVIKKAQHRVRVKTACLRILVNRGTILMMDDVMKRLRNGGLDPQQEEDFRLTAKYLASDLICNQEIFGFCDLCNRGKIRFRVFRNLATSVYACCFFCGKDFLVWRNVFEPGEYFGEDDDYY